MITMEKTPTVSSFDVKLALACAVAKGQPVWSVEIRELAVQAGELAGREDSGVESALIDLADQTPSAWKEDTFRFLFERAYWSNSGTDPFKFFSLEKKGGATFVVIKSRGIAGGSGQVVLHKSHVRDFFATAKYSSVGDYERWATDPYPIGGKTVLLRQKSYWDEEGFVENEQSGQISIDPDTHPSDGCLYFGSREQETSQLGALVRIRPHVEAIFEAAKPSDSERQAAAMRAQIIRQNSNGICFLPLTGYCHWCASDVTGHYDLHKEHSHTGCPVCGHTWCD